VAIPSIRLIPRSIANDDLPLGASRLGGSPDVPLEFEWPNREDRPLAFLAQIDLEALNCAPTLPGHGWLLFFYDDLKQPWGFDPNDVDGFKVVFVTVDRGDLRRYPHPPKTEPTYLYPCHPVDFNIQTDLPDQRDLLLYWLQIEAFDSDEDENSDLVAHLKVREKLAGVDRYEPYHHLLGNPQHHQSDMRAEVELASSGMYCGTGASYETPEAQAHLESSNCDWHLLLQIDSDPDRMKFYWGDLGRLYFWIRSGDLEVGDFTKVWMVLQCG